MFGALATGSFAILLQQHGTLIVLEDNVLTNTITLGFQKVSRPQDGWHQIIHSNEFRLGGASSVQLLLGLSLIHI